MQKYEPTETLITIAAMLITLLGAMGAAAIIEWMTR